MAGGLWSDRMVQFRVSVFSAAAKMGHPIVKLLLDVGHLSHPFSLDMSDWNR